MFGFMDGGIIGSSLTIPFNAKTRIGTGAAVDIDVGMDMSANGGLVWSKSRNSAANHYLIDSVRGGGKRLSSNTNASEGTETQAITAFNTNGYTLGTWSGVNLLGTTYIDWVFRQAADFFDVVTWSGTSGVRTLSHSLGSEPGMIIVKNLSIASDFPVYHRSANGGTNPELYSIILNGTAAETVSTAWNNTAPTTTQFDVGASLNDSGNDYVAYLFGHETSGTGRIFCGGFSSDSSGNASVTVGFEPQFIFMRRRDGIGNWIVLDTSRGWEAGNDARVRWNLANAEDSNDRGAPTATGFSATGLAASAQYDYMVVRKGVSM